LTLLGQLSKDAQKSALKLKNPKEDGADNKVVNREIKIQVFFPRRYIKVSDGAVKRRRTEEIEIRTVQHLRPESFVCGLVFGAAT